MGRARSKQGREKKLKQKFYSKSLRDRRSLGDTSVDRRIILKFILKELGVRA
jgi:hypothetical protein